MEEMNVQNKLRDAMRRPAAPAELVERTRQSARAVEAGKAARERLLTQGVRPGSDSYAELAAQVLIGRMAKGRILPVGATAEGLTGMLVQNPAFRKETSLPAETLLKSMEDGSLVAHLTQKRETGKALQAEQATAQKKKSPPQL